MNGRAFKLGTFQKPGGRIAAAIVLDDTAIHLAQAHEAYRGSGRKTLKTTDSSPGLRLQELLDDWNHNFEVLQEIAAFIDREGKESIGSGIAKVASKFDSRTILNEQGAEQLLGEGDMLFSNGAGRTLRVHGPFVSDDEVERIAAYLRDQGEPRYIEGVTDLRDPDDAEEVASPAGRGGRSAAEALYERAIGIVLSEQKASASHLQRRLAIGYNRAADLIERMEREGVVSTPGSGGRRQVRTNDAASSREQW